MSQMYICPQRDTCEVSRGCSFARPHLHHVDDTEPGSLCPACVPVVPTLSPEVKALVEAAKAFFQPYGIDSSANNLRNLRSALAPFQGKGE